MLKAVLILYVCAYMRSYVLASMHVYMRACVQAYMHAYILGGFPQKSSFRNFDFTENKKMWDQLHDCQRQITGGIVFYLIYIYFMKGMHLHYFVSTIVFVLLDVFLL